MAILKKYFYALALVVASAFWASGASAVTVTGSVSVPDYQDCTDSCAGGTGLLVDGINGISLPGITLGQTYTLSDLFTINITDPIDNSDDTTPDPITVHFNFTAPAGGNGNISGDTTGHLSVNPPGPNNTVPASLSVVWDGPLTLNLGSYVLTVALNNLTITCTQDNLTCAPTNGFVQFPFPHFTTTDVSDVVSGTLKLVAAVPVPASLLMLGTGLALLAGFGFLRKRRDTPMAA